MSVRIEDILEVVSFLKSKYSKSMPEHDFQELRLSAFDHVAARRGIDRTTTTDKFRQQLESAIASTDEFDRALRDYLFNDDMRLYNVLMTHSESIADDIIIRQFFTASDV